MEVFQNFAGQTKHIFGQVSQAGYRRGHVVVQRILAWGYLVLVLSLSFMSSSVLGLNFFIYKMRVLDNIVCGNCCFSIAFKFLKEITM